MSNKNENQAPRDPDQERGGSAAPPSLNRYPPGTYETPHLPHQGNPPSLHPEIVEGRSSPLNSPVPLGSLEQAQRIEALRRQAAALCGGAMLWGKTADFPSELEEDFWRGVVEFESAEPVVLFDLLLREGVTLPPPALLQDFQLPDKLWEVIYFLASVGCFLENTDHLSDLELYTELWDDLFRQPTVLFPNDPSYACHLDLIGSGSEEDHQTYLQYYACEETRRRSLEDFPDQPLPPRRPRPWDRDRHLPRPLMRRRDPLR
ncbi:MAG: hypothetical protein ACOYNR_05140 [Blastocatellia bacterium]